MRWCWRKQPSPGVPTSSGQWVDPSQLLFSLPTICDELPGLTEEAARPEDVLLHEDDWRQVELVAATHKQAISDNLAAIRQVRGEQAGLGFERIHVREEPRLPLIGLNLERQQLTSTLGPNHREASGVAFSADSRRISGAFAYIGPASTVYGLEHEGVITTLGVHPTSASDGQDLGVAAVKELAERHGAYLVDWLAARSYPSLGEP